MERLLYYLPSRQGGLFDYGLHQVRALAQRGVAVEVITPEVSLKGAANAPVNQKGGPTRGTVARSRWRPADRFDTGVRIMGGIGALKKGIVKGGFRHVLLNCYSEYLAPLWAESLRELERRGVVFGAVVHDPVRDYQVGPLWWHRRSIAAGYSFLREAFVHEVTELDTVRPMPKLRTTVIPHGTYKFPIASRTRAEVRADLGLPAAAPVVLAFGHVRDGKNLDLAIRALAGIPSAYLLVAGEEQSAGQKPISYYRSLAGSLKMEDRCRWVDRFVPDREVGDLFGASDLILLAYSRNFRSASGVLNVAVHFRKPCLASAGQSNLRSAVGHYNLGWLVEPDDLISLEKGFRTAIDGHIEAKWTDYEREHSWEKNAEIVCSRMFGMSEMMHSAQEELQDPARGAGASS